MTANQQEPGEERQHVTLPASALWLTQAGSLLFAAAIVTGLWQAWRTSGPQQYLLLAITLLGLVVLQGAYRNYRRSYQKITFTPDRIILFSPTGDAAGTELLLQDIESWNHHAQQYARGYGQLVTFTMKDGRKFKISCAAKYGPRIIAETKSRLGV